MRLFITTPLCLSLLLSETGRLRGSDLEANSDHGHKGDSPDWEEKVPAKCTDPEQRVNCSVGDEYENGYVHEVNGPRPPQGHATSEAWADSPPPAEPRKSSTSRDRNCRAAGRA